MKTIRRLFLRLFPARRATSIAPMALPMPAYLRRHAEAQDRGDFRP